MEKLAQWLRKAKKRPSHFAHELGVAPSTVSRALAGQSRFKPELAKRISEITGISLEDLLFN